MELVPKDWKSFQHYKDRCPPWIKLHKSLLDDRGFITLPIASKALAPLMWLLASEHKDGVFDAEIEELAFRLRMTEKEVQDGLTPLLSKGFFLDASTMLAPCLQDAIPETETEAERETKKETENKPAKQAYDDNDFVFAEKMYGSILAQQPTFKKPNLKSWAKEIRLMRERDNRNYTDMEKVFVWARQNDFWQSNILSAKKFREKYDTLTAQMARSGTNENTTTHQSSNSAAAKVRATNAARRAERERQTERPIN